MMMKMMMIMMMVVVMKYLIRITSTPKWSNNNTMI